MSNAFALEASAVIIGYPGEILGRINPAVTDIDLKVEVRTGSAAGGADVANGLTLAYILAFGNRKTRHMRVDRGGPAVVDDDIVAVGAVIGSRDDFAGGGDGSGGGKSAGGSLFFRAAA